MPRQTSSIIRQSPTFILDQMDVNLSELPHRELYNILLNAVAPRPIAWVSSLSSSGQPNLAPFSFFNCVCVDPPLLAFAPGLRPSKNASLAAREASGEPKDTLRNIRETKEFVVSVVTHNLAEAMNVTSGEYDPTVNEFELARLTPQPSKRVRPARASENLQSALNARCIRFWIFLPLPPAAAW